MSGGVDSSVAAALLADEGHEVIGLSMQLYDQSRADGAGRTFGSCCTLDDLHDARRVAAAIDIPHYVLNFERQFDEQVVSNFVARVHRRPHAASLRALQQRPEVRDAARSRARRSAPTPSPPATTRGRPRRADRPAARCGAASTRPRISPYFLFSLTQEQLARARFPVGDRPKDAVREYARQPACRSPTSRTARRSASSPTTTTRRSWRGTRRRRPSGGAIVDETGRVLGRHDGIHRLHGRPAQGPRALVATGAALRAGARAADAREVVVGPKASLERTTLTASGVNWIVERAGGAAPRRRADPPPPSGRAGHRARDRRRARGRGVRRAADRRHAGPGRRVLRRGRGGRAAAGSNSEKWRWGDGVIDITQSPDHPIATCPIPRRSVRRRARPCSRIRPR